MSNSARAKERRSKRSRISKHERGLIASQPKQEQRRIVAEPARPEYIPQEDRGIKPDTPPMSPARRAFQDV